MAKGPGGNENWGTRVGVILAVAGSAIGLGNFLRFPGLAAEWGGAFMIPYIVAFLVLGLPAAWVEWSLGRYGGRHGFNSLAGIFFSVTRNRFAPYLGVFGVLVPVLVYTFYVYVAAWCLSYAVMYATGGLRGVEDYSTFALDFIGATREHGYVFSAVFTDPLRSPLLYVLIAFTINFVLIYRGITRGIEWFCRWMMPLLACLGLILLVRVLTLTPFEGRTVWQGLGYMWNPDLAVLGDANLWLAAAGQVFFSLSLGFGVIVTYASYMRDDDDVALSGMTAASGNGFTEVVLAGLTIIPAGFLFLGAQVGERVGSTFELGFIALPNVFDQMPAGALFGFLFFSLLFIGAMTSTISLLQPAIAFFEEGLGLGRRASVTVLGLITVLGTGMVIYFTENLVAFGTIEFWGVDFLLPLLALIILIMYGWVLGVDKGLAELRRGAEIPVPEPVRYMIKYVAPGLLIVIFARWIWENLLTPPEDPDEPGPIEALADPAAAVSLGLVVVLLIAFLLLIAQAVRRWRMHEARDTEVSP